jgi:hypothetical protein
MYLFCSWMEYPSEKKMTETLHHALRAVMQFPVTFFEWILPSTNKKINSILKSVNWSLEQNVIKSNFSYYWGKIFHRLIACSEDNDWYNTHSNGLRTPYWASNQFPRGLRTLLLNVSPWHSRGGTIKILPAQRLWAPSIGLNFAALHRQWWRLH